MAYSRRRTDRHDGGSEGNRVHQGRRGQKAPPHRVKDGAGVFNKYVLNPAMMRLDAAARRMTRNSCAVLHCLIPEQNDNSAEACREVADSSLRRIFASVRFYQSRERRASGRNPTVNATLTVNGSAQDILAREFSDIELEIAAEEVAMSYTYQTSAYNRCCN
jgi:hypothetical protein